MAITFNIPDKPKNGIYGADLIWDSYMDLCYAIVSFSGGRVSVSIKSSTAKMRAKAKRIECLSKALVAATKSI
ncbi:hypothetical protein ES703_111575 [subsurface metagenome]